MAEYIGLAASDRVFVGDANDSQRHGDSGLHQNGRAGFAQAAMH
jgi:hypothetical protein